MSNRWRRWGHNCGRRPGPAQRPRGPGLPCGPRGRHERPSRPRSGRGALLQDLCQGRKAPRWLARICSSSQLPNSPWSRPGADWGDFQPIMVMTGAVAAAAGLAPSIRGSGNSAEDEPKMPTMPPFAPMRAGCRRRAPPAPPQPGRRGWPRRGRCWPR